jgi:transcriptional regulator with XRE-family HTH domain
MIDLGCVMKKRGPAQGTEDLQLRFGIVVRECRRRLGISQEELGWRAGLHRTYITDVERGVRNISIRSIASLAVALDVPISNLFARAIEIPAVKRPKSTRSARLGADGQGRDGHDGTDGDGIEGDGVIGGKDRPDITKRSPQERSGGAVE